MTMCDGATFDIHDVGRQPEFPDDCKRNNSEGLVDFDTLDVVSAPAGARQRLFDSGDRPEAEQTRLDRSDAVRHDTRDGPQATSICISFARQHHRRRDRVQPGGIARRANQQNLFSSIT
jgi:hypothetical protein